MLIAQSCVGQGDPRTRRYRPPRDTTAARAVGTPRRAAGAQQQAKSRTGGARRVARSRTFVVHVTVGGASMRIGCDDATTVGWALSEVLRRHHDACERDESRPLHISGLRCAAGDGSELDLGQNLAEALGANACEDESEGDSEETARRILKMSEFCF